MKRDREDATRGLSSLRESSVSISDELPPLALFGRRTGEGNSSFETKGRRMVAVSAVVGMFIERVGFCWLG